ncbi:Uncharacterized protein AXF42_Ash007473 [Apostasia shenzhenica]|uniref:Thiol-disulfide oxidoreductase DCC n=1 Tax=Apostasia shenzhenica TaxID=1088818 RepID=A0A2I0A5J0_9ASPA|nr:Uncharacterized protein AXF42_Ash007473 [Apostasia shenzhenica]
MASSGALSRLPFRSTPPSSFILPSRIVFLPRSSPAVIRFQTRSVYSKPKLKEIAQHNDQSSNSWKIKMLYDGECPLCLREVNMLRERNQSYGTIKFIDISSDDYSPEENLGLDYKTAMGRIHAIQSDGTVYTNVEAFRRLYEEVGLGWLYTLTKYEPISSIVNAVYKIWAKYRLQLTGRPSLEKILESKKKEVER